MPILDILSGAEESLKQEEAAVQSQAGSVLFPDEERAVLNRNLAKGLNPGVEAAVYRSSQERGIPINLARQIDNSEMQPPPDVRLLAPPVVKFLSGSSNNAAVAKGDEERLNDVAAVAGIGAQTSEQRRAALLAEVKQNGYTPEQLSALRASGYEAPADDPIGKRGVFLNKAFKVAGSYATVTNPIPEEWYTGPGESGYAEKEKSALLKYQELRSKRFEDAHTASQLALMSKEDASSFYDYLKRKIAVMQRLSAVLPGWRDLPDESLIKEVESAGAELGIDASDISTKAIRPAGFGWETDWGRVANVFGVMDAYNRRTKLSGEQLADVAANFDAADFGDRTELIDSMLQEEKALRGNTWANNVAEAALGSIAFGTEIAATGGVLTLGTAWKAASSALAKGGVKALPQAAATLGKGLGKDLAKIATTEVKRLPAYLMKTGLATEKEVRPMLQWAVEDGTVLPGLTEAQTDKIGTVFARRMLDQFIENTSEQTGGALPTIGLGRAIERMLPKQVKNGLAVKFMKDITTSSKGAEVVRQVMKRTAFNGLANEYFEEKAGNAAKLLSTQASRLTGLEFLNLGQDNVFGSVADEAELMATILVIGSVYTAPRAPLLYRDVRTALRFSDAQMALKDRVDASETQKRSPLHMEMLLRNTTSETDVAYLPPDAAQVFYQSQPEASRKLLITGDVAAEAESTGRSIPISMAAAQTRLSREELAELVSHLAPDPKRMMTVEQAEKMNLGDAAIAEAEERQKERDETKAAADRASRQLMELGRPANEVRAFSKLLSMGDYFAAHSGMTAAEWVDNLSFRAENESEFLSGLTNPSGTPRGAVSFNDSFEATVTLFKDSADASTLVHELAHYAHGMMGHLVETGVADETMARDLKTLDDWAGDDAEKLARGFERYILEGKAPAIRLQGAFSTLRRLMLHVYKSVTMLGSELSEEVKSVFDGMLASEREAQNESVYREIAEDINQELLGLNQNEAKVFRGLIDKANAQSLDALEAEKARQLEIFRPQWRREARAEMASLPVYQAWTSIRKSEGMDRASLQDILRGRGPRGGRGKRTTRGILKELYRRRLLASRGVTGAHPAAFAAEAGYGTVEQMITALREADRPRDYEAKYVSRQEAVFHENFPMTDGAVATQAAISALDLLAEKLAVKGGREGLMVRREVLRRRVREELESRPVSDVLSGKKLIGDCRTSARKLTEAANAGDFGTAFDESAKLRFNLELLRQREDAKKEVVRVENLMRKIRRAKKGSIDGDYRDALEDIAYRFVFTRTAPREQAKTAQAVFEAYNAAAAEYGEDPMKVAPFILGASGSYRRMALGQFLDLSEAVRFLYGEGREAVGQAEETFRSRVREKTDSSVQELKPQPHKHHGRREKVLDSAEHDFYTFIQQGTKLRNILGMAAGWKPGSAIQGLYDAMNFAESEQYTLMHTVQEPVTRAVHELHKGLKSVDLEGLPEFPDDVARKAYSRWTPEMLVASCLNMGTETNRQRLRDGFGWADADLQDIASRLSSSDWRRIDEIWAAIGKGKLTKLARQAFREERHFDLKMEEAVPFSILASDGVEYQSPGGYYPLSYLFKRGGESGEKIDAMDQLRRSPTHNPASFSFERAARVTDPVRLSLGGLYAHIYDVSHYITHRPVMREVLRVVKNPVFRDEFQATQGFERYDVMVKLVEYVANPGGAAIDSVSRFEAYARGVFTSGALFFNPSVIAMQLASAPIGINELGSYYFSALSRCSLHPVETAEFIRGKSGMMRDRVRLKDFDLQKKLNTFSAGWLTKTKDNLQAVGYYAMQAVDFRVAAPGWLGAYNKALDEGKAEDEAIAAGDEFVAKTQGAGRPIDISPIQLTALGRVVTPFFSPVSAGSTMMTKTMSRLFSGDTTLREKAFSVMTNFVLPTLLLEPLIRWTVAGGLGGDDDDKAKRSLIRSLLSNPFGGFPILRDIVEQAATVAANQATGKNSWKGDVITASPLTASINLFSSLIEGTVAASGGNPERAIYKISEFVGAMLQVPAVQVYDRAQRMLKTYFGEEVIPDLNKATKPSNNRGF